MNRRQFLKASSLSAVFAAHANLRAAEISKAPRGAPAILVSYTREDHRRRLANVEYAERNIRTCMRKHLITNYLPAHCVYNLGEYPARKPWTVNDRDEEELDRLRDHGIQLIQLHEEWNDSQRLFGADKYSPVNPGAFQRFVDMIHRRGMKIIVYVSTGFIQRTDPDFREEWARQQDLVEIYFRYARCSPASPSWRAYLLPKLTRILDDYGVDGLYNDAGYIRLWNNPRPPTPDEVLAFNESPTNDGAICDLLALIYAEVKRRGGIVKLHISGTNRPQTDLKVYDYLWVGEGSRSSDKLREATKNHPPYVAPCLDMSRARIDNEDELYLHTIPYMQFPVLLAGKPFTGERAMVPGIQYPPEQKCFWTRHCRAIWKHYQAHPDGPHSYGWWDSCPGRPEARPTHARWLKQYLPLVEEGTWAWLEISDSNLFAQPLPKDVVASAFANRDLWLVLANYGRSAVEVVTRDAFSGGKVLQLPARTLRILRKS
ncbi:MAG: alpha-amylase family protein [Verrucomicrobiae bacterium]|nr:alpha-amylase family protein [Verrucomicrobiae bacterium]